MHNLTSRPLLLLTLEATPLFTTFGLLVVVGLLLLRQHHRPRDDGPAVVVDDPLPVTEQRVHAEGREGLLAARRGGLDLGGHGDGGHAEVGVDHAVIVVQLITLIEKRS